MKFEPVTPAEALALARDVYFGHGKIEILPKLAVSSLRDIAVAFTPGVGHVVRHLMQTPEDLSEQTAKDNLIALVTNGTAVLGFGNIGSRAGMPVMEGKAIMFKMLTGVDCMPLCVDEPDPERLVRLIETLEPTFGGFNLEDVASPGCFTVMEALERSLPVPILHDDQYGTATVITAALTNATRLTGRRIEDLTVVVNGVGAAGTATISMLRAVGAGDIIAVDRPGILSGEESYRASAHWQRIAATTNRSGRRGGLEEALRGADVFIGLSVGGILSESMVRSMAPDPIVFALANPVPEIMPDLAKAAGAAVVASGRFDFPNHCNNVLAFPSLMRAALDVKAKRVSLGMCLAAARTIAEFVSDDRLGPECLLPSPLDPDFYPTVSEAIARQAISEGLARRTPPPGAVFANCLRLRLLVAAHAAHLAEMSASTDVRLSQRAATALLPS